MRLVKLKKHPGILLEKAQDTITTRTGDLVTGYQPISDKDLRYFEKVVRPDGRIEWFELREDKSLAL